MCSLRNVIRVLASTFRETVSSPTSTTVPMIPEEVITLSPFLSLAKNSWCFFSCLLLRSYEQEVKEGKEEGKEKQLKE